MTKPLDGTKMIDSRELARQLGIDIRAVYYRVDCVRKDPKHVAFPHPVKFGKTQYRFIQGDVTKFKQGKLVPAKKRCRSCGQVVVNG